MKYTFKVNKNPSYIVTATKTIKEGENIPYTHNNKGVPERRDNFLNERVTIKKFRKARTVIYTIKAFFDYSCWV